MYSIERVDRTQVTRATDCSISNSKGIPIQGLVHRLQR